MSLCFVHYYYYSFNHCLSGTTWVSRYQKGNANLDLLEQEIVSGSSISWAICTSAPRLRFLQAGYPSCHPTNSVKALKDTCLV